MMLRNIAFFFALENMKISLFPFEFMLQKLINFMLNI